MTDGKRKRFHALKNTAFGKDNDKYRDFLQSNFGKSSSKDLTAAETNNAIDLLVKLTGGEYSGSGKRGSQKFLTPGQAVRISILQNLLSWSDAGVLSFIERQISKKKAVQWLMNYEASRVILGLQKVLSNNNTDEYKFINQLPNKELRNYKPCQNAN